MIKTKKNHIIFKMKYEKIVNIISLTKISEYLRKNIDKVMKTMRWKVKLSGEFRKKFNKMQTELRIVKRNIKINMRDGDKQKKKYWSDRI